jgi:NitT/TauT family transport system permease protein
MIVSRRPKFFGLYAEVSPRLRRVLPVLLFALAILTYLAASYIAHMMEWKAARLMPSFIEMGRKFVELAIGRNPAAHSLLEIVEQSELANDTLASLARLFSGVALSSLSGLLVGVNMALFPGMRLTALSFVTFCSNIPAVTLIPLILIVFGTGDISKVTLIFVGTVFFITRDTFLATCAVPREQMVKACTLDANQLQVVYEVIMPQVLPRLIDSTRIALGAAWIFLITAESIAADQGLGFRIFLLRRYMAMDGIFPYVAWISILAYSIDRLLVWLMRSQFPWYQVSGEQKNGDKK